LGVLHDRAEAIWDLVSDNPTTEFRIGDLAEACGLSTHPSDLVSTHFALGYARRNFAYPAGKAIPCDRSTNTYCLNDLWNDMTQGDIATHMVSLVSTVVSLTDLMRKEAEVAASTISASSAIGRLVRRINRNVDGLLADASDLQQEILAGQSTP
jgi:hypothetical protein